MGGMMNSQFNTDSIDKAIDEINPEKSLGAKVLKLIISIGTWILLELSVAIADAFYIYDKPYGIFLFWGLVVLTLLSISYLIIRIRDLTQYSLTQYRNGVKISIEHNNRNWDSFIELYNQEIQDNEKSPANDMIRWIQEANEHLRDKNNPFWDFLITAEIGNKLLGFVNGTYYFKPKHLFISYLVVPNIPEYRNKGIASLLLKELNQLFTKQFKGCQVIVTECEYHKVGIFKTRAQAFKYQLEQIQDLSYRQPDLDRNSLDSKKEKELALLYSRGNIKNKELPSKEEVESV
jgi:hypothetical protein